VVTVDHSFGTWIKRRRKALDITQHELAHKVGCSVSLIFKIESDERRPSRQVAELLAQYLDIPPAQRELFLKIARQEKAIDGLGSLSLPSGAPLAHVSQRVHPSLPVPLTSLVGREHELRMIIQQIQDPACRLLTLTGPGGVGKTRLALEVAHQLRETSEDGTCFVSLSGTSTSELIIPAIADVLGLSFSGAAELKAQLFHFLRERRFLLILDNLEHLLDGIELLDQLLETAPGVKLIATSREPLNLRAEWVFAVQGLPVPSGGELTTIESNSAAALFLQRARQVKLSFTPSTEDLAAIARICELVEGLPLGLELAASWVNTLACSEIANEIERGLGFLSTTRRDIPERHRSLLAVFEHSWNLLSAEEQAVLKNLSVFQGGFRREAAEQVAGASLPLLSSLMTKSLLGRNRFGRYSQHELVRQFAGLRLHQDLRSENAARDRHTRHCLALWGEFEHQLKGSQQRELMPELVAEIDNFRAAWDWAFQRGQFELLGSSLRTLLLVYDLRGWYAEGIERVESIIRSLSRDDLLHKHDDILGLAAALHGWFHFRRGHLGQARESFEQALNIVRFLHDPAILAEVLSLSAPVMTSLGETAKALEYVSQSLKVARASGDLRRVAYALMMQGGILASSGRNEEAYASAQEALAHFRTLGDIRSTVVTLNTLGFVAMQLSRYAEARAFLQESLTLVTPVDDPWSAGTAYGNLGIVELAEGNAGEAQMFLQKSVSLFSDLGMKGDIALYLTYLGEASAVRGAVKEAEAHLIDAIRLAKEAQALPTLLGAMVRLAQIHADRGDVARAYAWARQVANHPASWQESKRRAERLVAELKAKHSAQELETIPASNEFPDHLIEEMLAGQP
jgi:predicted ATPase/transcriptional regulator with XRE-family HTH domain